MSRKIFIVDDEPSLIQVGTKLLSAAGYEVYSETNPVRALDLIKTQQPDLILLDLAMPEMNGLDVCRVLKADPKTKNIPVIFASVHSEEADVVAGLELGATDYVSKPLRERELLARVRGIFRTLKKEEGESVFETGPFRFDVTSYKVWLNGKPLDLSPKQFEVLSALAQQEGRVVLRGKLYEKVWGADISHLSRTMDSTIDKIRQKLGPHRHCLQTLKGVGYRFEGVKSEI